MLVGDLNSSIPLPLNDCVIPQNISGPVFIWLTSDGQPLVNDPNNRATSQLIAGPTILFVDTKPQVLNKLARLNPSNPTPITTVTTTTLSPPEVVNLNPSSTTQSGPSSTSTPPAGSPPSYASPPSPLEVNNPGSSSSWTPCTTTTTTTTVSSTASRSSPTADILVAVY